MKKIILVTLMIFILFKISFAKEEIQTEEYIVARGETLWSIACENAKEGQDVREYIYDLKKLNGIDSMIYEGQVIEIIK